MRVRFGRPPAFVAIAWNACGVEQSRAAVGERVIGFPIVADCAFVTLGHSVVTRAVRVADFFPNPPAIIRPDPEDIAVAIAEEDQLDGRFDFGPATHVIFVSFGTTERRRGSTTEPMHIDGGDAAGNVDLSGSKLAEHGRLWGFGTGGRDGIGVDFRSFSRAVIDMRVASDIGEQVGTPARLETLWQQIL